MKIVCAMKSNFGFSVFLGVLFVTSVLLQPPPCKIQFLVKHILDFIEMHFNILGVESEHTCPLNEEYKCGGSPCQTTCESYECTCYVNTFLPVNDCYCVDDYARDADGKCIDAQTENCKQLKKPCQ